MTWTGDGGETLMSAQLSDYISTPTTYTQFGLGFWTQKIAWSSSTPIVFTRLSMNPA